MRSFSAALLGRRAGRARRARRRAGLARVEGGAAQGDRCRCRSATSAWCSPTSTATRKPADPLVTDRGHERKVHVVLPAYKAAETISLVAHEMPVPAADRALLVDDASPDDTVQAALREGFDVLRHPRNRGYGANQKTCYVRAALDGADVVVMVHADNQYDPALVAKMVRPILDGEADVVIGSRLLEDETIAGGMPRWKWVGNRFLTEIENRAFRRRYSEYHTGYRAFSTDFLRSRRVPAQQRRLRLRPADLRPDRLRRRARGRAGDPHPLLPRGVERLVPHERLVRPAHAGRADPLPARRVGPLALAAAAPPGRAPGYRAARGPLKLRPPA